MIHEEKLKKDMLLKCRNWQKSRERGMGGDMRRLIHKYLYNDKISIDFNVRWILVVVFFSLILCACQKRTEVMIYSGSNDYYDFADGLDVENGDYQAALIRCQERLQQLQEDSIEAADVYSQMGDIYADYVGDKKKPCIIWKKQ